MSALDEVLPRWHMRERHSIPVDAPAELVFEALREVTLAELPVSGMLFRLRGLGSATARPVFEQLPDGFRVLGDDPGREVLVGAVGRPWRARGGMLDVDPRGFDRPGFARMVMSFRLDGGELSTETRVHCTDERSRRRFRLYWLAVGPFSGLIRREWLRAIKRRAESSGYAAGVGTTRIGAGEP